MATTGAGGGGGGAPPTGGGPVDLNTLTIPHLRALARSLEQDLKSLSNNYASLKIAQNRFLESEAAVTALTKDDEGGEILVPVSESMYVPGTLGSLSELLVDVGTGYFIRKDAEEAGKYMGKKAKYLAESTSELQTVLEQKQEQMQTVKNVLQQKIAAEAGKTKA